MMGDGRLPAGAGDLVPGAALAAVLESVDVGGLDDPDLVGLLQAQSRQLAHVQGQVWAVMAELARRDPMPLLGGEPLQAHELFDLVVDEVRAELMLTRAAARVEVEAAVGLAALPAVAEALGLGLIDRRRALVFTDACWDLRPEHAEQVVAALLPEAMSVTATGLAARVARAVIELDPGWAERRYREALRSRKVVA
ncbi:MAG: hypothetical protein ACTHMS_09745, partial [Jatrophihabitans sp.]